MADQLILLAWQKDFAKTKKDAQGNDIADGNLTVRSNAELYIPAEVVDWLGIPVPAAGPAPASGPPRSVIKSFTRRYYGGLSDTTGATSTVAEHERDPSGRMTVIKKVARLNHTTLKIGDSNRPRTMSIRFPNFFNLIMISQALGSMVRTHNPGFFVMDGKGGKHALIENVTTDVFPGYKTGAWVVTAKIAEVNTDDTSAGTTTVPGASRKRKAAATP